MGRASALAALAVIITTVAACGDAVAPDAGSGGAGSTPEVSGGTGDRLLQGVGMVLENADHGPQLCLGGIGYSYPPQCSGPDLVGWDWAAVEGAESASGSTWGSYAVTGTWANGRLTVTAFGAPETGLGEPAFDPNLTTPCQPPAGGWAVVDPATATDDAMQRALTDAGREPDYAGAWIDQSTNPAYVEDGPFGEDQAMLLNDPTKLVLNVMFTGDLDRHEAELRAVWGGALCVSSAPRSEADLLAIQSALADEPGVLGTSPEGRAGTIEASVILDDGLQQRMDEQYGAGVVVVLPALHPVD